MGCDGGSIPKRSEMVHEKTKKEIKDKNMYRKAKWFNCAITQENLKEPIVSCKKGYLYNKEAILEHILKINTCKIANHIKKIKHIKTLNLTINPLYTQSNKTVSDSQNISKFICPITNIEMNGFYRFGFYWKCGCVISDRAIKEIPSNTCQKCGNECNQSDFIYLNEFDDSVNIQTNNSKIKQSTSEIVGKQIKINKIIKNNSSTYNDDSNSLYKSLFTSSDQYKRNIEQKNKTDRGTYSYF